MINLDWYMLTPFVAAAPQGIFMENIELRDLLFPCDDDRGYNRFDAR